MSTTIYRGPAQVEYGGVKFQSKGAVTVTAAPETFDVVTEAHGIIDERIGSLAYTVTFTPSGQWGEVMDLMAGATGRVPGESMMGGSLVIRPMLNTQKVLTLARAGLTGLPALRLSAQATLWDGDITFTALHPAGTELWSATTGLATFATHSASPDTGFGPAKILTEPWTGIWDADPDSEELPEGPWNGIHTEDGWTINVELATSNAPVDDIGIADVTFVSSKTTVSCVPVGITEEEFLAALQHGGTNALGPGRSVRWHDAGVVAPKALRLTNRSGTYVINFPDAGLRGGSAVWAANANRLGRLTWVSSRKFTSGVPQALMSAYSVGG